MRKYTGRVVLKGLEVYYASDETGVNVETNWYPNDMECFSRGCAKNFTEVNEVMTVTQFKKAIKEYAKAWRVLKRHLCLNITI
jgi:hypothetical protein